MLAVHAYEQGLVHESDNRYKLSLAIQDHHETLGTDLPLTCLDKDTLEEFYHSSLKVESWALALPSLASKPMVTDFNTPSWDMTLRKKKLCSMDAVAVLKEEVWREFFRNRYSEKAK